MESKKCTFCDINEIREGLLDQTDNFYHRANVRGSLAPGHSMIISKGHLPCFGALPAKLWKEYKDFYETIERRVESAFYSPIMIEQGIHGQSVPHAHTHFIPAKSWYDFTQERKFISFIPKELALTRVEGIEDICKIFEREGEYVSIQEDGELYICRTKGYNGKLRPARDFIAQLTGNAKLLDWRKMTPQQRKENESWIAETIEKLCRIHP